MVKCSNVSKNENAGIEIKTSAEVTKVTVSINDTILKSEITCPKCSFKKMEIMPTDVCLIKYKCEKCKVTLFPKEGDCCVFCTYGTEKCPSKQG